MFSAAMPVCTPDIREANEPATTGPILWTGFARPACDTGQILKGAEFADLPVVQSTKFEFVINLQNGQRARPRSAADARADGVIE
jgi:hypothetical protein